MRKTEWIEVSRFLMDEQEIAELPDHLWRFYLECQLIAASEGNRVLPDLDSLSWYTHREESEVKSLVNQLKRAGLIYRDILGGNNLKLSRNIRPKAAGHPPGKQLKGWVYIVTADDETYKIGASVRPQRRIGQLNTAVAGDLKIVHTIPADDMYALESALHDVFDDKQVTGEWFRLSRGDVRDICSIGSATNGQMLAEEDKGEFAAKILSLLREDHYG